MQIRREFLVILAAASLIVAGGAAVLVLSPRAATGLLPFASYAELADFLTGARSAQAYGPGNAMFGSPSTPTLGPITGGPSTGSPGYSGTNVQVAGVDELDMVKTDGTYLYIASGDQVHVLLAYPATSLSVVARIPLANLTAAPAGSGASISATGLFLDGAQLLVVGQTGGYGCGYGGRLCPIAMEAAAVSPGGSILAPLSTYPQTLAFEFNVSNPADPVLEHTISVTGTPATGRMSAGVAYLVTSQWIPSVNGTYVLPQVCVDGTCSDLPVDHVYHDPQSTDAWDYTNLLAVDLATGGSSVMSVVTGGYSTLYMSPSAIYLAFYKWAAVPMGIARPMLAPAVGPAGWTTIYKLAVHGLSVAPAASADVPGSLLSQYAMDEWDGYLRVATTLRTYTANGSVVSNGLYVFDGALGRVGSITGLAPGESIFAVRFVEDRAYVVTFRRIDPLFVVDLSNPADPAVSGYLEMPGFSDYLYPLDSGHLVGVGKDATPSVDGNWSWYQGLKLSLYDVSSPTAPSETANVTLGDRGTDSEVLTDPHAFLYVPARGYVVLPVDLAVINASLYPGSVPDWAWGTVVWQGVYVFHVNETAGFREVGRIAHDNGTVNATCGWLGAPNEIRRSLYIGDTLYTVSGTEVMANALSDLAEIASLTYAPADTSGSACPIPVA